MGVQASGTSVPRDLLHSIIAGTLKMQVDILRCDMDCPGVESYCLLLPPVRPASRDVKDAGRFGLMFDDCMRI
jgi:hypothetical protein